MEEGAMSASIATLKTKRRPSVEPASSDVVRPGAAKRLAREPSHGRRARSAAAAETPAIPEVYELRSTVRYRGDGRALNGIVVGIAHDEPLRYDIRRLLGQNGKGKPASDISFGVPHGRIERLLAPPPPDEKVVVLSDLPPEPTAPVGQGAPRPAHKRLLAQLLGPERQR
jgi:hypothetical protein